MTTAARRERILSSLYRAGTTVPALAGTLGVSKRTVYRDVAALREAGHDIRASPGPGGGVRVAPDGRPRPVHFEVSEIVGLALSVAILKATPHIPFAKSAEAALDRARMALSPERRRSIQRLEKRILVGAPAAERIRTTVGAVDDAVLSVFEQCFTRSLAMSFAYVDHAGASSSRRIECVALVLHTPSWYVLAWDLDKDAARLFRMDRMAGAACGDEIEGLHPLAEVLADASAGEPEDNPWRRRPIG